MIIYVVLALKRKIELNGVDVEISREKGFEGYLPTFRTLEYAKKFAGKKYGVFPMRIGKEEQQPGRKR